jgi:hypothetical protein
MSTHFTSISKATSGAHYYEQDSVFFLTHERSEQENFAFTTGVSLLESRVPNIMATTPSLHLCLLCNNLHWYYETLIGEATSSTLEHRIADTTSRKCRMNWLGW